ncbi:MAG: hypothetical protein EBT15_11035 [Betaproteobacteria bacterium]|nr:hypothetical protein [Betaproteobacteria bacterium]
MFAVIKNNVITQFIKPGQQLIIDGFDWGYNWAEYVDRDALGIKEVAETQEPDQRFYWVSSDIRLVGANPMRVHTAQPKALAQLKEQHLAETKRQANSRLAATDWMVIRKAERGIEISADVAAERARILDDCAAKEAAITVASTVEELILALNPPAPQLTAIDLTAGTAMTV